jgi:hypothetical protein
VKGSCFNIEGKDTAYYEYEIMPKFSGGVQALLNYLGANIRYPPRAKKNGTEGKVYIEFVVDREGYIINAIKYYEEFD